MPVERKDNVTTRQGLLESGRDGRLCVQPGGADPRTGLWDVARARSKAVAMERRRVVGTIRQRRRGEWSRDEDEE